MGFNYKPLKKILIDKGLNRIEFLELTGVSKNVYAKINNNESISLTNLVKICEGLKIQMDEVVQIEFNKE